MHHRHLLHLQKFPPLRLEQMLVKQLPTTAGKDGDLLLVKWGYGRTADKVYVDTLIAGVGGDYQKRLHQPIVFLLMQH